MPSPFPGMDPFIEGQLWDDFHSRFVPELAAALMPKVRPKYLVTVERRVYLERTVTDHQPPSITPIRPDVTIAKEREGIGTAIAVAEKVGVEVMAKTFTIPLPIPERVEEPFITIRDRESREIVTVIEVLSPANKRAGSDGRREYLQKREAILLSGTHLVELDLLRGGERMPTQKPLPPADYYALIAPAERRPYALGFAWTLKEPLPTIPIPLKGDDPEVKLDLQGVFTAVYERAGYDYMLDYGREVEPPLSEEDKAWVRQVLEKARLQK